MSAQALIAPQSRAQLDGYAALFAGAVSSIVAIVSAPAIALIRPSSEQNAGTWQASAWQRQLPREWHRPEASTPWTTATASGHRSTEEQKPLPKVVLRSASELRTERLAAIQSSLGLPVQELAKLLNISRPQLYKWLDASNPLQLQSASRQRLDLAEDLAEHWRGISSRPLWPLLRNGHESLLAELTAEQPDASTIKNRLAELGERLAHAPKSRSQLLREAGFAIRPSARSLPSDA